jgi:hypothetical protein
MKKFALRLAAAVCVAAVHLAPAAAEGGGANRARLDYMLHCSGCHDMDGSGHPGKGIPSFQNQIGFFVGIPEGRALLMQVPGLLSAGLSDERAAAVTTWLVKQFAGPSLPDGFTPYTAEEARRYRETRPADITAARQRLYRQIVEAGYPVE